MELIPIANQPGVVELVTIKIADALLWAGRVLHGRWAVVPKSQPVDAWSEGWRMGILQFTYFASRADVNFSIRKLREKGIATRQTAEAYLDILTKAGVLVVVPRGGVYWAATWNRHRLGVLLRRRMLELPYPIGLDAPALFQTRGAVAHKAQHTQPAHVSREVLWAKDAPPAHRGLSHE